MNCGQIQKMLPACLDGILSKTENALIENHLASCDSCRAAFEEYQRARKLMGNLEEVEPPSGFARRIIARLEEAEAKKAGLLGKLFYPLHIKIPIQAVAMVVVAVLAIQTYRAVEPEKRMISRTETASAPQAQEETGKKAILPEEPAKPEKRSLPIPGQETLSPERAAKDTVAESPPASLSSGETRLRQERAAAIPPAPAAPAATREAEKGEPSAGKKAKMEMKAAAPAPAPAAASLHKTAQIGFALQAANPGSVREKVQMILREIGGSRIETISQADGEIVTAELNPERLPQLLDLLKPLGEMKGKFPAIEANVPSVSIRIEILGK